MFGKGTEGNAVIVARETHEGMYRKGVNVQAPTGLYHHVYDFIADVTPDGGGEVFRATFTELFGNDIEHRPVPGETARVKIGKDREVTFDRRALAEQATTQNASERDRFTALGAAAPGAGGVIAAPKPTGDPEVDAQLYRAYRAQLAGAAAPAAPPVPAADPLDQIAKAAELHKAGVLSNEEFAALKAKLLS
jgi:hypothetical protein